MKNYLAIRFTNLIIIITTNSAVISFDDVQFKNCDKQVELSIYIAFLRTHLLFLLYFGELNERFDRDPCL